MDASLIIIWVLIFIGWYIYEKIKKKYEEFDQFGVEYKGLGGTYKDYYAFIKYKESMLDHIMKNYKKFNKQQIVPNFDLTSRGFLIRDAEIIKQITIKDFDFFVNHDRNFNQDIDKLMGKMLVLMVDDEWRNMRSVLSPIFTSSKMKMMFGILSDCASEFMSHYEEKVKRNGSLVIDCKETFSRFTVDGICSAVLGFKGDCVTNDDSELYKFTMTMQKPTFKDNMKFLVFAFARKIYLMLQLQMTKKETYDFFYNAIVKVMKEREEKGIFRPDVIQLLLQAKKGQLQQIDKENEVNEAELSNFSANIEYDVKANTKKSTNWTDVDFMAQGLAFFSAGHDTTQTLLQVTAYNLAKNKDVQEKLIAEIDEVVDQLGDKPVSYDVLHKMKYLDMVISEALRYWPPAVITTRECDRDYSLKLDNGRTMKLKKGDAMSIPIYALHHDEKYFEHPEKFDPERFSDERKASIVDGSYIPFGYGPRICIGSRFALMEAKLLVFNILSKFTMDVCDETPEKLELAPAIGKLFFKKSVHVELKLRK